MLLARGVLLAPAAGESSQLEFLDAWGAALPVHERAIPENWVTELEKSARNAFPIALRIRKDVGDLFVRAERLAIAIGCLKLEDVDGFVFRTEEEKERFLSWSFENVPEVASRERCSVDATKFHGEGEATSGAIKLHEMHSRPEPLDTASSPSLDNQALADALRRSDSFMALLAVVVVRGAALGEWVTAIGKLSSVDSTTISKEYPWLVRLLSHLGSPASAITDDLDSALLGAVVDVILRHSPDLGWPAEQVLDEIREEARSRIGSGDTEQLKQDLDTWVMHCSNVIGAKVAPPILSDEKSIVRRAILLLLMRGGIQDIAQTAASDANAALIVGPVVRMLALALAAIRTGFRAMPREYKFLANPEAPSDLRAPLANVFVADFQRRLSGQPWHLSTPIQAEYQRRGVLEGEWVLRFGDAAPIIVRAQFDPGLKELASRAKRLGFEVTDEEGRVLRLALPREKSHSDVYLSISRNRGREPELVRFSSEVAIPNDSKPSVRKRKPKSASTMQKEFFLELLKEQNKAGTQCRFGLSDNGEKLYVISEVVHTMDDAEFRRRIVETCQRAAFNLDKP